MYYSTATPIQKVRLYLETYNNCGERKSLIETVCTYQRTITTFQRNACNFCISIICSTTFCFVSAWLFMWGLWALICVAAEIRILPPCFWEISSFLITQDGTKITYDAINVAPRYLSLSTMILRIRKCRPWWNCSEWLRKRTTTVVNQREYADRLLRSMTMVFMIMLYISIYFSIFQWQYYN